MIEDPYQIAVECLYDLSRDELRYLALECLEISDGVDSPMRKRDDMVRLYMPPWWRPLKRHRWEQNGPTKATEALTLALMGDRDPIRRIGRLFEGTDSGEVQ